MKRFITAIILLVLIGVVCITETTLFSGETEKITKNLTESLEGLKEGEIERSMILLEKANEIWSENEEIFRIFSDEEAMSEISNNFVVLKEYLPDDVVQYRSECMLLISRLEDMCEYRIF